MSEVCIACAKKTASGNHHCSICKGVVHSAIISFSDFMSSQAEYCSFRRCKRTTLDELSADGKAAEDLCDEENLLTCARCVHQQGKEGAGHEIPKDYSFDKSIFKTENVTHSTCLSGYLHELYRSSCLKENRLLQHHRGHDQVLAVQYTPGYRTTR